MTLIEKILGKKVVEEVKSEQKRKEEEARITRIKEGSEVSFLWYFLPILFGLLGGLIGWALLRDQNRKQAGHLFLIGVLVTCIGILWSILQ